MGILDAINSNGDNTDDKLDVSWGNALSDDSLVWIPHALCRYANTLKLTFDDIGFIIQCFSFRGNSGIHPSHKSLAYRGGYKTRNPIIKRFKRLEEKGYVIISKKKRNTANGMFDCNKYSFKPLNDKLIELLEKDIKSGKRSSKHN